MANKNWPIFAYVIFVASLLVSCDVNPTTQNKNVYKNDPALGQLPEYAALNKMASCILTDDGRPVDSVTETLQVGRYGPLVLYDCVLLGQLAHLNRERIPPRVVHAPGAGARGYFVVTNTNLPFYSKAAVFAQKDLRTPVYVRFSIAGPSPRGTPDVIREIRGFAIKLCTPEGTWDLVGNDVEVFFINNPNKFSLLIHSQGRNPVTNLKDPNMFWDFATRSNETANTLIRRFSKYGLPCNFRTMDGHGINTFKMVNASGAVIFVKFHYLSEQGLCFLSQAESDRLSASDPDHSTRDLYDNIDKGNYPKWTLYFQYMTAAQAEKVNFDILDDTKEWPKDQFPFIEMGTIVLNQNVDNFFAKVETIAFCPCHVPPGIELSLDPILQARAFAYEDAQRYRLGVNFLKQDANLCPFTPFIKNYEVDGEFPRFYSDGAPNYYPNSYNGPVPCPRGKVSEFEACGTVKRYAVINNDFSQPRAFYLTLNKEDRADLAAAIILSAEQCAPYIQVNVVKYWGYVHADLAAAIKKGFDKANNMTIDPQEFI